MKIFQSSLLWSQDQAGVPQKWGSQTIRLLFGEPQEVKRNLIGLRGGRDNAYTGVCVAIVLKSDGPFQEIVRQQWNFSAPALTREIEDTTSVFRTSPGETGRPRKFCPLT